MNPPNYPNRPYEPITLNDGRQVLLRPIRPDDAPLLQEGFQRLSPQSIYMRFMEVASELSDEQAHELATVDYHNRMAFVSEVQEDDGKLHLVGVARYSALPGSHPRAAEAAIVVRDDYQGNGLGKASMDLLIRYARQQGIELFTGTMWTTNQRILDFVSKSGLPYERNMIEPGVWDYKIFLNREPVKS